MNFMQAWALFLRILDAACLKIDEIAEDFIDAFLILKRHLPEDWSLEYHTLGNESEEIVVAIYDLHLEVVLDDTLETSANGLAGGVKLNLYMDSDCIEQLCTISHTYSGATVSYTIFDDEEQPEEIAVDIARALIRDEKKAIFDDVLRAIGFAL